MFSGAVGCGARGDALTSVAATPTVRIRSTGDHAVEMNPCRLARREVVQLSAGASFSCARFADDGVVCWGGNQDGQLGQGDTRPRGDAIGSLASLADVSLTGEPLSSIASGGAHSCVLTLAGKVGCWGNDLEGVLGVGRRGKRGDEPGELGSAFSFVDLGRGHLGKAVSVGAGHVCTLLKNGSLKCWGWNQSGQLGLGDQRSRGYEVTDMGDALPTIDLGERKRVRGLDNQRCGKLTGIKVRPDA